MAVAKSYERYPIVSDVFLKEGRKYVKVRETCGRCGGSGIWAWGPYGGTCFACQGAGYRTLEVRWYTDKERAAQNTDKAPSSDLTEEEESAKDT